MGIQYSERAAALLFESPAESTLDNPDQFTVSPRGGFVVCEGGARIVGQQVVVEGQRLVGLTLDGEVFPFAQSNIVLNGEKNGIMGDFRGAPWSSRDGEWLFANIILVGPAFPKFAFPGLTVAITGSWSKRILTDSFCRITRRLI